jgi:hypothetical protein
VVIIVTCDRRKWRDGGYVMPRGCEDLVPSSSLARPPSCPIVSRRVLYDDLDITSSDINHSNILR